MITVFILLLKRIKYIGDEANEVNNIQPSESTEISKDIQKLIEKAVKLSVKRVDFPYPCEASVTLTDNDNKKN